MFLPSPAPQLTLPHITTLTHEGKVLVFGTTATGEIWYTVKQDGFEDNYAATQVQGWEDWQRLEFPGQRLNEQGKLIAEKPDASVIQKELREWTVMDPSQPDGVARVKGEPQFLLRSRYSTYDQSATAPVQLVSAMGHLYVFRQSQQNTLLCDRFVLDGITNQLVRKLEVRFKRSGQKHQPLQQSDSSSSLTLVDSLDFQDTQGNPFYEPTKELCLVNDLHKGWFSVILLPTTEHDQYFWHIFAYHRTTQTLQLTSIRSSQDGLFDLRDTTVFEANVETDRSLPRRIPGIVRRTLELDGLPLTGGLTATKYDLQVERLTDDGEPQLLREATRVMVVAKTAQGNVAALSFAVAADGTLAQIDAEPEVDRLRSRNQSVLLALDTLDRVQAIAAKPPVAQGKIIGVATSSPNTVKVTTAAPFPLQAGDVVKIAGTANYNGHYTVEKIDDHTFEIATQWIADDLGEWEVMPPESHQILLDGMITAFEQTPDGKLRVQCPNHELQDGDAVQITGSEQYNGTFAIAHPDDRSFTVNLDWQPGAAVNLAMESRKRRGIHLSAGLVEIPYRAIHNPKQFTLSCWVKPEVGQGVIATNQSGQMGYRLAISNNTVQWSVGQSRPIERAIAPKQWTHLAGSYDGKTLALYINGTLAGSLEASFSPNASQPLQLGKDFSGQIADLQLWKVTRPEKDIKDSMYLQLTGKEVGLVGYWRLGAIAEPETANQPRQVVDFSIHSVNGTVHGNVFVSAVTLSRTLKDGTPVTQYTNEELFAVTQRATYEETFELKLDRSIDPNNANGKGDRLFTVRYWGKANRTAEARLDFPADDSKFEQLADGWWRSTTHFTVPDGVTLVRSFELADVRGEWKTLEIRKHEIQRISDTISQANYRDRIRLTSLADNTLDAEAKLRELSQLERQETALILEQRLLKDRLDNRNQLTQTRATIDQLKREIANLDLQAISLQNRYIAERDNLFNYWCRLCSRNRVGNNDAARIFTGDKNFVQGMAWGNFNNQKFRFEPTGGGFYAIICSYENRILDYNLNTKAIYGNSTHHKAANQQWSFGRRSDGFYHIHSRHDQNIVLDHDTRGSNVFGWGFHGRENQQWQITNLGVPSNNVIQLAEQAWKAKLEEVRLKKAELARLEQASNASEADRQAWQTRLDRIVNIELPDVQKRLNASNTNYLDAIARQAQTPQTMPQLVKDARGLITQGAILSFVRPMSRVTALETADGLVQLNYFDTTGKMRQTHFDATADSANPTVEEWLPDAQRVCLNCNQPQSKVLLDQPVPLGETWTIEAWICLPLPEVGEWNTVVRSSLDAADHPILIRNRQRLGSYLGNNGGFHDSGYDLMQLSLGWHHVAAVGSNQSEGKVSTQFYIDGQKVGEIATRCSSHVSALGNHPTANQAIGKLAEVRIWEVALSPDEIAVNSKTLLSGREPSLLAYYPLNEGRGEQVRDRTGIFPGKLQAASWWGCSAPIGNPGHAVMHLDGADFLEAPCPAQLTGDTSFTVSFWMRFNGSKDTRQSILYFGKPGRSTAAQWLIRADRTAEFGFWEGAQTQFSLAEHEGRWVFIATVYDASRKTLTSYLNGQLVGTPVTIPADKLPQLQPQGNLMIGKAVSAAATEANFKGVLSDLRIWNIARTQSDLQSDMSWRLTGTESGLVGYWMLGELMATTAGVKTPGLTRSQDATVQGAALSNDSVLPFGGDAVICAEYSSIGRDPKTQRNSAMLRRFLACPTATGLTVLPDKRVETLELKWIGNAQFAPTLLGYIEGAPPVPSENLTRSDDYNGATSVQLTQSEDVEFRWSRSQDAGLGAQADLFFGIDEEFEASIAPMLLGKKLAKAKVGATGSLSMNFNFQNASTISAKASLSFSDRLELQGSPEASAKFPDLGTRFVPKNIGYALVVSSLADVYITRLQRSQRMIGYQVRPVEDIPPDINTITFLMNPAYTMNGSLDGMTGSRATSDRFFRHVPEMRSQYGSLYPASYFRLQEAYNLKQQIDNEDKRREAYFAQFNSLLVDEASLDREIGSATPPAPIVLNPADGSSTKPNDAKAGQDNADRIGQQAESATKEQSKAAQQRQAEIDRKITDQEQRTHATASFAHWQKRMEDIQIQAGKRNIVNTYVWDADGGLRAEAQSFANTAEHSIGGSFSLNAGLGMVSNIAGGGLGVELTATATINLTQTMNKTEQRSRGLQLDVDLSGVERIGITDFKDNPILPGEKVDRYRFMSFYLEGSTSHFHDFFSEVVDPEWLQSNDEEARALRQTQAGKPNKAWRVLHRVTYVERPALKDFGRDVRSLSPKSGPIETRNLLAQLGSSNQQLEQKLDAILKLLQAQ